MKKYLSTAKRRLKYALPDRLHIRIMYLLARHELVNLKSPRLYSEKIQWLKIYGNLEQYTGYVDKYEVRNYIETKLDQRYLIPLIGVWDDFDAIPFNELPNQFVIKATHGSGYNTIVTDKQSIDREVLRQRFTTWIHENYYNVSRESQYKLCKPRIIVEKYIQGEDGDLKDYKIYCFKGKPEMIVVASNRSQKLKLDIVDLKWNRLPVTISNYPNSAVLPPKPKKLSEMLSLAEELSKDFPFVRVDLYAAENKIYFGELTFTPGSGLEIFGTKEFNLYCGSLIDLSAYKPVAA